MEKLYYEVPGISRKGDAIDYIREFREYQSDINGIGGLDRFTDNYEGWLEKLEQDYTRIPNEEKVPARTFFLVRDTDRRIVGMINIRLCLNERLSRYGGHMGYSIRPTERGKGYNRINLYLGLKVCAAHGIDKVFMDADLNNPASWKTMEALGGTRIRQYYDDVYAHCTVVDYNIDVKKALKEHPEFEEMVYSAMPDRTIPFCNTIMKCSDYECRDVELPEGYSVVSYQPGYEKEWAKLEYAIGDFDSATEAEKYFVETYLQRTELLPDILFVMNEDHRIIGSCIAWQDMRGTNSVSSLHWLVVDERYQGIGLGKALATAVMNIYAKRRDLPVYIHTQPWSWKAILLYISLGFKLQKTDTFSHYENEYEKAMTELRKILTKGQFELLQRSSEE